MIAEKKVSGHRSYLVATRCQCLSLTDEVIAIMAEVPGSLQREPSVERVAKRMVDFIESFEEGMGDIEGV